MAKERVNMWLDDVRPIPKALDDGTWVWVKTMDEAQKLMQEKEVVNAYLDNDLGYVASNDPDPREPQELTEIPWFDSRPSDRDGIDLVKWMCREQLFPTGNIIIHSWNLEKAIKMEDLLKEFCPNVRREMFRLPDEVIDDI